MKTNGGKIQRLKTFKARTTLPDEDEIEGQWKAHKPSHLGTPVNKLKEFKKTSRRLSRLIT